MKFNFPILHYSIFIYGRLQRYNSFFLFRDKFPFRVDNKRSSFWYGVKFIWCIVMFLLKARNVLREEMHKGGFHLVKLIIFTAMSKAWDFGFWHIFTIDVRLWAKERRTFIEIIIWLILFESYNTIENSTSSNKDLALIDISLKLKKTWKFSYF